MILLRAILFSFAILWRMIVVFPFMLIAMIVFGIIATILMVIGAFISPIISILIAIAFGVSVSVIPILVGARMGLQAKGASTRNTYFGLALPSLGYGFFEAISVLFLMAGAVAAFAFLTPLSAQDLAQTAAQEQSDAVTQLMEVNPALTLSILWVSGVLLTGLRAALLMPYAGASIGADPSGRAHTPFYGFGSNFIPLLILVAISYLLWAFAVPIAALICFALGYGDTLMAASVQLENASGLDALNAVGLEVAVFAGIVVVLYLWSVSLQCAGGVLAYMREREDVAEHQAAFDLTMDAHLDAAPSAQPQKQMQSQDVMELIRSRMQNNQR